jgi:hypothetical protein
VLGSQHPPPVQVFPAQQAWPAPPQVTHWSPVHSSVADEHAEPLPKQVLVVVSQHPVPRQVLLAQQAWVLLPQAVH